MRRFTYGYRWLLSERGDYSMEFIIDSMTTPIGEIRIISDGENLRALDFEDYEPRMLKLLQRQYGQVGFRDGENPGDATVRLGAYFAGDLEAITSLRVASNGSEFQQQVWRMLRNIPSGKTWSYGQLAKAIGKPSASRAVGLANGSNPIAIVVPCHRVIGADGSLTGYGGGLARKQWLLQHEGALAQRQLSF